MAPWRESALRRGFRSFTALPLKEEGADPFGALCIYSAKPNVFTPEENRLLEELAGNLAFGIHTLRVRAERKETQKQLLASEQLFRALVENAPDFIVRYDRSFRRVYVNPATRKLFGDQAKDVIGKTPADQSPLSAPRVYMDRLRQTIATATENTVEIPYRTPRGEMHWGHIRFVPEFGPDGKVLSVLAIGRDIHEIKENEQRFRTLAENFPRLCRSVRPRWSVHLRQPRRRKSVRHAGGRHRRQNPPRIAATQQIGTKRCAPGADPTGL